MSNDNFEKPSGQGGRNWILLAAVFLALVVVGGGVALLVMKDPHMRQVVMGTWDSGKPADVDSPERFSKQGIAFEYPGNWQVLEKKSNAEVPVWIELKL